MTPPMNYVEAVQLHHPGRNRRRVFLALETPKAPTQLSKELKIHLPHISRSLSELEFRKLVECLTPGEKVGRIYRLSAEGRRVLRMVKELDARRSK
jgi:predicted transcriptional regulator